MSIFDSITFTKQPQYSKPFTMTIEKFPVYIPWFRYDSVEGHPDDVCYWTIVKNSSEILRWIAGYCRWSLNIEWTFVNEYVIIELNQVSHIDKLDEIVDQYDQIDYLNDVIHIQSYTIVIINDDYKLSKVFKIKHFRNPQDIDITYIGFYDRFSHEELSAGIESNVNLFNDMRIKKMFLKYPISNDIWEKAYSKFTNKFTGRYNCDDSLIIDIPGIENPHKWNISELIVDNQDKIEEFMNQFK